MRRSPALFFALTLVAATGVQAADVLVPGVDPRVYLQARKPVPQALRDLKAADAALSVRILREGPDAFLVDASAYPAGLKPDERASLRAEERRALLTGAMGALAAKRHPQAAALIGGFLEHKDAAVRAEAAERLGETGADVVRALATVASRDQDAAVRAAACAGLGRHRSAQALSALAPLVVDDKDHVRQIAAVRALGMLTSRWAWQARGDVRQGEELRERARVLLARAPTSHPGVKSAVTDVLRQLAR